MSESTVDQSRSECQWRTDRLMASWTSPGSSNENLPQISSVVDDRSKWMFDCFWRKSTDDNALAVDYEDPCPRTHIYIILPDRNMSRFIEGCIGNVEMSPYSSLRCGNVNQS